MKITSRSFLNNQNIPSKYTCDIGLSRGVIPSLKFGDSPKGTLSFALVMDDPDAPSGNWDHWLVANIPVRITEIKEGIEPDGIRGLNSWQEEGYGGPCPGVGTHRYFFKLYALDCVLDIQEGFNKEELEKAMEDHIIEKASLVGLYKRK